MRRLSLGLWISFKKRFDRLARTSLLWENHNFRVSPSPYPSERLDRRGVCRIALQNIERQGFMCKILITN